jgi:DNA-directed RNA polymerase sigma subunit (sigma70/sigma32)
MSSYLWPNDDGWPYPDSAAELADPDADADDDALLLKATPRVLDCLEPLERKVVTLRYGLDGSPPRSMKELHGDLGLTRAEVRTVLAGSLAKLRTTLTG